MCTRYVTLAATDIHLGHFISHASSSQLLYAPTDVPYALLLVQANLLAQSQQSH